MYRTRPANIDLFRLHEHNPDRYPFLLESVASGTAQSQFDILFAFPRETSRLTSDGQLHGYCMDGSHDFLSSFDYWFNNETRQSVEDTRLPFHGGWFVYLAYEMAGEIEKSLVLPGNDDVCTMAYAVRCPAAVILDHVKSEIYVFAENEHTGLIADMEKDIQSVECTRPALSEPIKIDYLDEEDASIYRNSVDRIKKYIVDGDVFQVNLSRLWKGGIEKGFSARNLYRKLRLNNPAPFSSFAALPDFTIISSSPERLVSVKHNRIETRPIAGTRPRSENIEEDERLSSELMAHPKEQAEHIMLIDLERNDLGRVCKPGSIDVDELMALESYTHVHHIVSNISGELCEGTSPADIIRAVFPGGTITGCPKVRCMQIIAELEEQPRGAYTGSLGYVNLDGSMDLNILIRTLVVDDNGLSIRAGAGIVYDSDPQSELAETRAKARGLLMALSLKES
ncbi:MAG TPA: aminodeoxychorismate synthase component I [Gammaproteobacteria bacterium]|nr:aminodeoxychorismate synthase component I [Gammaproteobacteria bacterium]